MTVSNGLLTTCTSLFVVVVVIEDVVQTGHEKPDFYRIPTRRPTRGICKPRSGKSYLYYGGFDYDHYCDNDNDNEYDRLSNVFLTR